MKKNINYEIAKDMLDGMPQAKKDVLAKCLDRNLMLTSTRIMEQGTMTVYKEGFYLELDGTRTRFAVYARDNDGKLEYCRKPREGSLHKIYSEHLRFDVDDFRGI